MNTMRSEQSKSNSGIICIGAANIDICCAFDQHSVDGTSNIAKISQDVGGAALNTARMLAAAKCNTKFIGLVGEDDGANHIARALKQANVENGLINHDTASTGQYISLLEPNGSLKIACNDMNIHENFTADLLKKHLLSDNASKIGAIFCDANTPANIIKLAFELMPNSFRCATTVSPSKAHRLSGSLSMIDMLFTNVTEAEALLGLEAGTTTANELVSLMAASPVKSGTISNGDGPIYYWQDGKVASLPIPPIDNIVDVIGAGDALAAGTIAALLDGENLANAVQLGINTAQKVLTVSGAYSSRFA